MTLPLVLVEWIDSSSVHASIWGPLREAIESGQESVAAPAVSVGFLAAEDRLTVTLVPHLSQADISDPDTECSGDLTIPRVAIRSIRVLARGPSYRWKR